MPAHDIAHKLTTTIAVRYLDAAGVLYKNSPSFVLSRHWRFDNLSILGSDPVRRPAESLHLAALAVLQCDDLLRQLRVPGVQFRVRGFDAVGFEDIGNDVGIGLVRERARI